MVPGIGWAETLTWFEGGFTAYPGQSRLVCTDQTQCREKGRDSWQGQGVLCTVCTVYFALCVLSTVYCVYCLQCREKGGDSGHGQLVSTNQARLAGWPHIVHTKMTNTNLLEQKK